MKRSIAIALIISAFTGIVPVCADDNSLLMMVNTESTVRNVSETMFGVNSEWGYESENLYLDSNYCFEQNFKENFESYLQTPAEMGEIYTWTSQTEPHTYIRNAAEYDGNASESTFIIDGDLYENQYINGKLQHPKQNIDSHADKNNSTIYAFEGMINDKLKIGGLPGWRGFSSRYEYLHVINNEDLQVVQKDGNKCLCLAPRNYSAVVAPNGIASFFGRDKLGITGGMSELYAKVKVDNVGSGIRIHLVKNGELNAVGDEWRSIPHGGQGTAWAMTNNGEAEWLDIVTLASCGGDGSANFYIGKSDDANLICPYTIGTEIDLRLTLNLRDSSNPSIAVNIGGITKERSLIDVINETNGKTCIQAISGNVKKEFDLTTNGYYAILFSALTGKNYNDSAKVYLDDLEFNSTASSANTLNNKFVNETKNKGIRLWRFGGSSANLFKWKYTLGSIDKRKPFTVNASKNPTVQRLGIVEGLKTALAINPDMKFSYVINFNDSLEDIEDLAEFLMGGADTVWGAKRIEYGIEKPVNIVLWEMGNELDKSGWTVERYVEKCKQIIPILRKYTPNVKIGAIAATDLANYDNTAAGPDDWNIPVARELEGMVDCYVGHEYYHMNESDMLKKTDIFIDKLRKCDESLSFAAITEHASAACYNTETGKIEEDLYYKNYSMGAVLQEAEFYNRNLVRSDGTDLACYHSVKAGPWNMVYEENNTLYGNAMLDIMELYSNNAVGEALKTDLEGFSSYNSSKVTGSAVKDKCGNVNIFLSNWDSVEKKVNISIDNNNYSPINKTVICADSLDSFNGKKQDAIVKNEINKYTSDVSSGEIVLPPYSVVMVKYAYLMQIYEADFVGKSIRIDGVLGASAEDKNVTLMMTDINDPDFVYYIAQTKADSEGRFSFRFETGVNSAECSIKVNALGRVFDLSGKSCKITNIGKLFDVSINTRYIDETHAVVTMDYDNGIIMPNVEYTAVFASYKNGALINTSMKQGRMLERGKGQIVFNAEKDITTDDVKVFLWNKMKPMCIVGEEDIR